MSDDGEWKFYRDREDWLDVTPIPQNDGPVPVVQIAYSERFKDVHDYFRAVLKSGEKSQRVLDLTEDALELNPANYTVWHYRREVLKAMEANIKHELQYCREMIEEHPKNYQVWQHRRVLVEWLKDPSSELRLTEIVLAMDQKNYHAWQHRQWVLLAFNLFDQELTFINRLLDEDVRNNSAWNQRFYVINQTTGWTPEVVRREVEFTMEKISLVKRNESAWNYLRGILSHCESQEAAAAERALVKKKCEDLIDSDCDSSYLHGFMVELYKHQLDDASQNQEETLQKITQLCRKLSEELDTVRCRYWKFISDSAQKKYATVA